MTQPVTQPVTKPVGVVSNVKEVKPIQIIISSNKEKVKDKPPFIGTKNLGTTIAQAVELFGEDGVYELYRRGAVIYCQQQLRKDFVSDLSTEEIQQKLDSLSLHDIKERSFHAPKSKEKTMDAFRKLWAGANDEERKVLLEELKKIK